MSIQIRLSIAASLSIQYLSDNKEIMQIQCLPNRNHIIPVFFQYISVCANPVFSSPASITMTFLANPTSTLNPGLSLYSNLSFNSVFCFSNLYHLCQSSVFYTLSIQSMFFSFLQYPYQYISIHSNTACFLTVPTSVVTKCHVNTAVFLPFTDVQYLS